MAESDDQQRRRRDRTDDRNQGELVAYEDENGTPVAWTGDGDAPYVKVLDGGDVLMVEGGTAAGVADAGNPVKIGGLAQALGLPTAVDVGDRVDALFDVYGRLGILPWAVQTDEAVLRAVAPLTSPFVVTDVIDVRPWREISLSIRYASAAVGGYPQIIPSIAKTTAQPAANTDFWSTMNERDATATNEALTNAMPAGIFPTVQPSWAVVPNRPLVLALAPALAIGNIVEVDVTLKIANVKWLRFLVAERGVPGTPGTLGLRYNLGLG